MLLMSLLNIIFQVQNLVCLKVLTLSSSRSHMVLPVPDAPEGRAHDASLGARGRRVSCQRHVGPLGGGAADAGWHLGDPGLAVAVPRGGMPDTQHRTRSRDGERGFDWI